MRETIKFQATIQIKKSETERESKTFDFEVYAEPTMRETIAIEEVMSSFYGDHIKLARAKAEISHMPDEVRGYRADNQAIVLSVYSEVFRFYRIVKIIATLKILSKDPPIQVEAILEDQFEEVARAFEVARNKFRYGFGKVA